MCCANIIDVTLDHLLILGDNPMPLPKVPNGLKLTVILPADDVIWVKTEAVQKRTQPNTIIQRGLAALRGISPPPEMYTLPFRPETGVPMGIRLTTRQKQAIRGRNLYALLQDAIAMKLFTLEQFLKALGVSPSAFIRYWKPGGKVPVNMLRQTHAFLENHVAIEGALKEAVRVPDYI